MSLLLVLLPTRSVGLLGSDRDLSQSERLVNPYLVCCVIQQGNHKQLKYVAWKTCIGELRALNWFQFILDLWNCSLFERYKPIVEACELVPGLLRHTVGVYKFALPLSFDICRHLYLLPATCTTSGS